MYFKEGTWREFLGTAIYREGFQGFGIIRIFTTKIMILSVFVLCLFIVVIIFYCFFFCLFLEGDWCEL